MRTGWLAAGLFCMASSAWAQGAPVPTVMDSIGVTAPLAQLATLAKQGKEESPEALALRQQVMDRVMLASFDVDEMLGRVDAEEAHVGDSRYVLESQKEKRDSEWNIATFAISGALGTSGSAMQLTRGLNRAGGALNVAAGGTALLLSLTQLKLPDGKRMLLSPYNMLAEVLGQEPNAQSHYPTVVVAYLHSPTVSDGQLPDGQPPETSLQNAWVRLHRLQFKGSGEGASLASVTSEPGDNRKLTLDELADREAMLRDLHGTVALIKVELRNVLLQMKPIGTPPETAH